MQEPRTLPQEEDPRPKPYKKKASSQSSKKGDTEKSKVGFAGSAKSKKTLKSNLKTDASQPFQRSDGCGSDSLPEYSSYSSDYRGLRHKYLFLEEESISLDQELNVVESEIKALENEKFGLLDQLVVLEGLVDPSELKSKDAFL